MSLSSVTQIHVFKTSPEIIGHGNIIRNFSVYTRENFVLLSMVDKKEYVFLKWKSQNAQGRTCINIDGLHVSYKIVDICTWQVVSIHSPLKTPFFLDFYIEMRCEKVEILVFLVIHCSINFSKFKVRNVKMHTAESVQQI